jgi:hypothetical protein
MGPGWLMMLMIFFVGMGQNLAYFFITIRGESTAINQLWGTDRVPGQFNKSIYVGHMTSFVDIIH